MHRRTSLHAACHQPTVDMCCLPSTPAGRRIHRFWTACATKQASSTSVCRGNHACSQLRSLPWQCGAEGFSSSAVSRVPRSKLLTLEEAAANEAAATSRKTQPPRTIPVGSSDASGPGGCNLMCTFPIRRPQRRSCSILIGVKQDQLRAVPADGRALIQRLPTVASYLGASEHRAPARWIAQQTHLRTGLADMRMQAG